MARWMQMIAAYTGRLVAQVSWDKSRQFLGAVLH